MKSKINILNIGIIILMAITVSSCNTGNSPATIDETPTHGNIKIGVDQSFQLLTDTEIYTFESIYPHASITPQYKPELDILNDFLNDSVRLIITCRKLTTDEEKFLKSNQIVPRTTKIAYDALAFIVNKNNPDSLIRYDIIKDLFTGKINNWNQINPKSKSRPIKIVFDNNKSANVRYIREKYGITEKLPENCYAVDSNQQVINYVEKNVEAIGLLSVNWISDKHDSVSHSFLNRIRVVAISSEYDPEGYDYYKPYQAYVADKSYPFVRDVYLISRETFSGLGSGFAAFVAGDKGQRIILKSRLVPATMPVRLIQIKK
jgi:phosphate transport system substrate-binding protein